MDIQKIKVVSWGYSNGVLNVDIGAADTQEAISILTALTGPSVGTQVVQPVQVAKPEQVVPTKEAEPEHQVVESADVQEPEMTQESPQAASDESDQEYEARVEHAQRWNRRRKFEGQRISGKTITGELQVILTLHNGERVYLDDDDNVVHRVPPPDGFTPEEVEQDSGDSAVEDVEEPVGGLPTVHAALSSVKNLGEAVRAIADTGVEIDTIPDLCLGLKDKYEVFQTTNLEERVDRIVKVLKYSAPREGAPKASGVL